MRLWSRNGAWPLHAQTRQFFSGYAGAAAGISRGCCRLIARPMAGWRVGGYRLIFALRTGGLRSARRSPLRSVPNLRMVRAEGIALENEYAAIRWRVRSGSYFLQCILIRNGLRKSQLRMRRVALCDLITGGRAPFQRLANRSCTI